MKNILTGACVRRVIAPNAGDYYDLGAVYFRALAESEERDTVDYLLLSVRWEMRTLKKNIDKLHEDLRKPGEKLHLTGGEENER